MFRFQLFDQSGEIARRCSIDSNRLSAVGMRKFQAHRVQRLTTKPAPGCPLTGRQAGRRTALPVDRITYDGMPDMGHMDSYLVRSSSLQTNIEQRTAGESACDPIVRHRRAAVSPDHLATPIDGVSAKRRID